MGVRRKSQRFEDHLCPRLRVTDVSGETVHAKYRPAWVPCSCWCASQWELSVGVKSLLHPSRQDAKNIRDTSVGQPEKSAVADHRALHRLQQHHCFGQNIELYGSSCERCHWHETEQPKLQQGWWPHVEQCLASCGKHAIQSGFKLLTPTDNSHWLAHQHEHGTRASLYLARTVSADTSVTWRRGQRWWSKRWLFLCSTIWHG
jgi:cytochrome c5